MKSRLLLGIGAAVLAVACGRTDAGITTSVKTRLVADDLVKARQIDVDTRERVVTLRGEVRSAAEEAQALQIARSTDGVADVVDQLSVVPEAGSAPTTGITPINPGVDMLASDVGITSAVKAKLLADDEVGGLRIDVDTRDGMVTLSGTVRTEAEKREAREIASRTAGVKGVTDHLTVETR
jgi:hyperosmotically inducible periplasmic protein